MNFSDTLEYMYNLLPMYQRVGKVAFKKDLTNTLELCEFLGNPQNKFKSVHIAGTNGKGSSAHMIASILQSAGYRTGLYTSPHLKSFTERIRINGQEIEEQFVSEFIERIRHKIEAISPSFFEITVAMAFDYFAARQVDIAVVEVGLGGRFDSTNVLTPMISLITSIGLDHTDMLGETLPEIAFEKAGIIKNNVPVVISETQEEVADVFQKKANLMHAPITFAEGEYQAAIGEDVTFTIRSATTSFNVSSDIYADYQVKNIPGVMKVIELLANMGFKIDQEHIIHGLQHVSKNTGLLGRWQKLHDKPLTICDTAHNESGVRLLVHQIEKLSFEKLYVIWGSVEGKELNSIFKHLPKEAFYYFCEASIPRAMKAEKLLAKALDYGLAGMVIKDVNMAITTARQNAGEHDVIIIAGSNFIVAEITNLKGEEKAAKI